MITGSSNDAKGSETATEVGLDLCLGMFCGFVPVPVVVAVGIPSACFRCGRVIGSTSLLRFV